MGKAIYLQVEKTLNHSKERVWKTVAEGFGDVSNYNPEIKSSKFDSEIRNGIGMKRHCDFQKSGYIKEEIVEWNEGQSFKLTFSESSVPMALLESQFEFEEQNQQTIITQKFWYRMKAPMGWMSGLMKGKMKQTLENGLKGLETYLGEQKE